MRLMSVSLFLLIQKETTLRAEENREKWYLAFMMIKTLRRALAIQEARVKFRVSGGTNMSSFSLFC